ncbi:protein C1orf43 homolog [Chironomus tepperi]|uniref:protein C1orf43 homolog n=1 Tax=Chironomus tepperi TaxID=113505 RepID=UPI00391F9706
MIRELSGPLIVLLLAGTVLTATIFIIFAKRQITRFTLRSRHTPHAPLGQNANKPIKKEIERRLDVLDKLFFEPQLLAADDKFILKPGSQLLPYYYRMKAVDDVKLLDREIPNRGSQPLRSFLINYLSGCSQKLIHQFCDSYEHARYDPNEYGDEEYQKYHHLLLKMIEAAKLTKQTAKTSPSRNRTPTKKSSSKIQPLLDPSRLKPPTTVPETRNSQLNLSIGLQQQQLEDDENEILSISQIHDVPKIEML